MGKFKRIQVNDIKAMQKKLDDLPDKNLGKTREEAAKRDHSCPGNQGKDCGQKKFPESGAKSEAGKARKTAKNGLFTNYKTK